MFLKTISRMSALAPAGASLLFLLCSSPAKADEGENGSFVYVMTNEASANHVVVFEHKGNALTQVQEISTGGQGSGGSGDPLGSQGSLTLSNDQSLLFAANAGSDEITSFTVDHGHLTFADKEPSGGTRPVSVTAHDNLVYVANAGGSPNVTGFVVHEDGRMTMIPGSTVALPGGSGVSPAQVSFTRDGESLIVTDKGTNMIDIVPLPDHHEPAGAVVSVPANGPSPFGFAFAGRRKLAVTQAGNGTVSSYRIEGEEDNQLQPVTNSLADMGMAPCWIVTTRDHYAFVVNSATASIASLGVASDGTLTLIASAAAGTGAGSGPIDESASSDGRFLYVITTNTGSIFAFRIDGAQLTAAGSASGLPMSIQGIAAE